MLHSMVETPHCVDFSVLFLLLQARRQTQQNACLASRDTEASTAAHQCSFAFQTFCVMQGVKESSSRHNGVTSAAAAADAVASFGRSGTRQSRRLAAFAEAQSHADSPTLMQQSVQAPVPSAAATVAPCSQLARNAATTGQALTAAQAAAEHREGSGQERQQGQLQQQGQVRTQQGQAPPQLSQAVLEASASAMRTLVGRSWSVCSVYVHVSAELLCVGVCVCACMRMCAHVCVPGRGGG